MIGNSIVFTNYKPTVATPGGVETISVGFIPVGKWLLIATGNTPAGIEIASQATHLHFEYREGSGSPGTTIGLFISGTTPAFRLFNCVGYIEVTYGDARVDLKLTNWESVQLTTNDAYTCIALRIG